MNDEVRILQKIEELFDYRLLPWMKGELGIQDKDLETKMVELQYRIFLYDNHLERNKVPDKCMLHDLWRGIQEGMYDLGYGPNDTEAYLWQISTYAHNELMTREGQLLSSLPMKYFYYFKSCDVRLMRRIIMDRAKEDRAKSWKLGDWMIFDWVTEINDDVSDVEEDLGTYNGNRFLDMWKHKGGEKTKQEYLVFLAYCQAVAEDINTLDIMHLEVIRSSTLQHIRSTRELIVNRQSIPST